MRINNNGVTKTSFKRIFMEKFSEFQQHIQCAKNQYGELMSLKNCLKKQYGEPMSLKTVLRRTYLFVQMHFTEGYKCSTQDEVQLAH